MATAPSSLAPGGFMESVAVTVLEPLSESEAHTADESAASAVANTTSNDEPAAAAAAAGAAAAAAEAEAEAAPRTKKKKKDNRSAAAKKLGWGTTRRRRAKPKGKPQPRAAAPQRAAAQERVAAHGVSPETDELAAETAWAVQSMLDSDSEHEDVAPAAAAAAAAPAAAAASSAPKKRVDRRSRAERDCGFSYKASPKRKKKASPKGRPPKRRQAAPAGGDDTDGGGGEDAIPTQRWSLGRSPDYGPPLLPQTGATDHLPSSGAEADGDDPHPLRCGPAYDNMRRLLQHATAGSDAEPGAPRTVAAVRSATGRGPLSSSREEARARRLAAFEAEWASRLTYTGDDATWKPDWETRWRDAARGSSRPWRHQSSPADASSLWEGVLHREFVLLTEVRKLSRRGGLPSRRHDAAKAETGQCKCGCKPWTLSLKQKAIQGVDMSRLIDSAAHTARYRGELCSSDHGGVVLNDTDPPTFRYTPRVGKKYPGITRPAFGSPRGSSDGEGGSDASSEERAARRCKSTARRAAAQATKHKAPTSGEGPGDHGAGSAAAAAAAAAPKRGKAADAKGKNNRRVEPEVDDDDEIDQALSDSGGGDDEVAEAGLDAPGREFISEVLTHKLRKHRCKDNDTVVAVCRKLKMQSHVKEIYEINRRRLFGAMLNCFSTAFRSSSTDFVHFDAQTQDSSANRQSCAKVSFC